MNPRTAVCLAVIVLVPPAAGAIAALATTASKSDDGLPIMAAMLVACGINGQAVRVMGLPRPWWKASAAAVAYGVIATLVYTGITLAVVRRL